MTSIPTAQFNHWRITRANRRTSVPDTLRKQAFELLTDYRKNHVIKALNINNNMLKNWQAQELTLTYAQDTEIKLKGNFSLAQLTALIQGFTAKQLSQLLKGALIAKDTLKVTA